MTRFKSVHHLRHMAMWLGLALLSTACAMPVMAGDIAAGTAWHDAPVTLLDVDFPETGFHARWEFLRCDCGEVLIRLEQSAPEGVLNGELVVLGGQAVLARGTVAQSPDLESMLQAPTLMLQLAFGLMQRAIPGGPADVATEQDISVQEPSIAVQIDTGVATGYFGAPWSVTGRVWAPGPTQRRFDLRFGFSGPTPDTPGGELSLTGGQDYGADGFPLSDETLLDGWRVQWLSEAAEPVDPPAGQTLGELRAEVREQ